MITAAIYAGMRGAAATRISARYGKLLRKMLWKSLDAGIADFREIAALKSLGALSLTIIAAEEKESSLKMYGIIIFVRSRKWCLFGHKRAAVKADDLY